MSEQSGIWAKSVLASQHSIIGKRIDTLLVRMPRCILAEFNTHRVFSRNAASSRAIPVEKLINQVENDPFIPMVWTKNKPGMQGEVETRLGEIDELRHLWNLARVDAVHSVNTLLRRGVHKQIANRILEPWMFTIVLVTATEWDNFFALRDHPAAEPHMQLLARAIRNARDIALVQKLEPGEWHMPFLDELMNSDYYSADKLKQNQILSVARCASTSYKTVDNFDMTLERATKIYDSMLSYPMHASPFEHVAQADALSRNFGFTEGEYDYPHEHRNFIGFRQLRAQIEP